MPEYLLVSNTYKKVGIDEVDYIKLDEEVEDFKRIMENSDRCVEDIKKRMEKSPIINRRKSKDSDNNSEINVSLEDVSGRKRLYLGVSPCKSLDGRDMDLIKSKEKILRNEPLG